VKKKRTSDLGSNAKREVRAVRKKRRRGGDLFDFLEGRPLFGNFVWGGRQGWGGGWGKACERGKGKMCRQEINKEQNQDRGGMFRSEGNAETGEGRKEHEESPSLIIKKTLRFFLH